MDCKICYEIYDNALRKPISLSCGHTFCSRCLDTLSRMGNNECSICKKRITSKLSNFALLDVIDTQQKVESKLVEEIENYTKQMEKIKKDIYYRCYQNLENFYNMINSIKNKINNRSSQLIKQIERQRIELNEEANSIQEVQSQKIKSILKRYEYDLPKDYRKMEKQELEKIKLQLSKAVAISNPENDVLKNVEIPVQFDFEDKIERKIGTFKIDEATRHSLSDKEISKGLKVWNKKEALKFFKKAIEFNPNNIDAHFFMGETLYKLKKVKEAYSFFNKAVELCPYEYLAYKIKGDSYKAIKNYDTAIKCYDKSIELNSSNILAYLEKADCFEKNEMFEKAIECFDTVIELFPQDYQGVKFKGELLQKLGRS